MIRLLLDTNICIYIIKNKPESVRQHFSRYTLGEIAISSITVAELAHGVAKSANQTKNREALEEFLLPLTIIPFDTQDAHAYGQIRANLERRGEVIGNMDMLIAAQALAKNCKIVTNNTREFERVEGLVCENWVA